MATISEYSETQLQVAKQIVAGFTSYGLPLVQIMGPLANADAESSLRPDVGGDRNAAGGFTAWGLWQLHYGPPGVQNMSVPEQCAVVWHMLNTTEYAECLAALKAATASYDAAVAFCQYFERPGAPGQLVKRGVLGTMWFEYFSTVGAA